MKFSTSALRRTSRQSQRRGCASPRLIYNVRQKIMRTSFYTYFSSGCGTLWFFTLALSFFSHRHVETGSVGIFGFPIIALVYALYRRYSDLGKSKA